MNANAWIMHSWLKISFVNVGKNGNSTFHNSSVYVSLRRKRLYIILYALFAYELFMQNPPKNGWEKHTIVYVSTIDMFYVHVFFATLLFLVVCNVLCSFRWKIMKELLCKKWLLPLIIFEAYSFAFELWKLTSILNSTNSNRWNDNIPGVTKTCKSVSSSSVYCNQSLFKYLLNSKLRTVSHPQYFFQFLIYSGIA